VTRTVETYEQAVEYLYGRINYELVHSERSGSHDFKLDRIAHLLDLLGSPHERVPAVHIAGTKGKGSTASMVAEILRAAGYRVGLFTSPHVEAFEERMRVDGRTLSQSELVELINEIGPSIAQMDRTPGRWKPTYFEITTALAWRFFEQQQVDVAVMEVGLGGRLDATNVCRPEVTLITSISRDHTNLLGESLEAIAEEKAGIVKPGIPMICGAEPPGARRVVERICRRRRAPLWQLDREITVRWREGRGDCAGAASGRPAPVAAEIDVATPSGRWHGVPVVLRGLHQARNAALAVAAVDAMRQRGWAIGTDAVRQGMVRVQCPLRIELLAERPTVIVDAAHNWASIAALTETISRGFTARRRVLIFATARDKDVAGHLRLLLPEFDTVILTQYLGNPRALPVGELLRICRSVSDRPVHWTSQPSQAWKLARRVADAADLICVTGSFFIAAELRSMVLDNPPAGDPQTPGGEGVSGGASLATR